LVPPDHGLRESWAFRPPGGESYGDGELRATPVFREIDTLSLAQPILIVGHAGMNRILLKLLMNLTQEEALSIDVPHDLAYMVEGTMIVQVKANGSFGTGLRQLPVGSKLD
jgi:broad specificity phosphatase PhoE